MKESFVYPKCNSFTVERITENSFPILLCFSSVSVFLLRLRSLCLCSLHLICFTSRQLAHINPAALGMILAGHRNKPRIYIGCMTSGPVLYQKDVKYHEPEYWKFGDAKNNYFRHATGQIYAISRDLANISENRQGLPGYSAQVLEHPWLKEGEASDKPIDSAVLCRMKQFRAMNKLKKLALKVIAANLSEEDIKGLKARFTNLDTDNSGTITYEELKTGLARLGSRLSEAEVQQLMDAADVDGNGTIDYIDGYYAST
ncbi:hypothetical protein MLD38_036852 [Melastoma candidum]|uniref:Uncharacterized protein n=1 Tax=Melastoma candidum TaxID=119954 RepID=A0ACB9LLC8_9MYRT|nr:hypothetical protein MLD38_036852 [Melastoma candidum]